jgi:lipopolysaccharide export system permease protein
VPIAALMLTLLAIPLAYVNPRVGRSANLFAAAFLYMLYSNCLNIVQSMIAQGKLDFWSAGAAAHGRAALRRGASPTSSSAAGAARAHRAARPAVKTLTRYIGREAARRSCSTGGLVMPFAFFDLIHELRDVGKASYTVTSAFLFVALQMPSRMYELFPIAALIGTLFALAQFVANSEYTVMRASGASLMQVTWALFRIGIPLAIVTFLAGEYVAPPAERIAQQVKGHAMGDTRRIMARQFSSGFWFKQDYTFANIRSVLADLTLVGVRIYEFDSSLALKRLRVAESGRFAGNGEWRLTNVATTEISPEGTRVTKVDTWSWETVLRPSLLTVYQVAPERLEIDTLYDNIRVLGSQKTSRFEIAFWNKSSYPATVVDGAGDALRVFQRQGGIGFGSLPARCSVWRSSCSDVYSATSAC